MKKSTPKLAKIMNRELIINELKSNPEQSRADLSKKTKLSKPTVSEIVNDLIKEELVFETGVGPSSGGKKPIYLVYNARSSYVIGISIENDIIFFAIADMNGEIIKVSQTIFTSQTEGQIIIDLIIEGIMSLLESVKADFKKVLGVVVGISGIEMDSEGIIISSPTIKWHDINLRKELLNRLKKDVIVENDVNLMTVGEFYKGQGKNISDFVYLFIGNGIGSGLFLNGKLYKGFHSASGEIGYMMLGDEQKMNLDSGVFETNYGMFGVTKKLREINVNPTDGKNYSLLQVLQKHKDDKMVGNILNDTIDHWAKVTINIISLIDPQAVIISGELVNMDQSSLNRYKQTIEKFVPRRMPEIKATELGSKAGLYGAVYLALENFSTSVLK
ncbi:ROK family transcriptional regulator [Virgibacillus sp. NKC19-3]|uniref:ROK family transcriptional regulator n=1 Tax=Virgibacillus saliphilus TaxID=2831674 RepID=UPI001C9ABA69|nr:ROK family transcriptional regulator [Virgibacillus sp. NKC19-3]MBY7142839.1 ROK family transcriptional regulator [Virgibacillus sp. NKC19-3]